jgi:hypothetical protein
MFELFSLYNKMVNIYIIMGWFCIGFIVGYFIAINTNVVIQKSSDSDWEYSTNQNIEKDTTITEVKLIGRDTLYPTVIYKVIKR